VIITPRFTIANTVTCAKSGAKATAVQTLRDRQAVPRRAKRLECGAFTAAFSIAAFRNHLPPSRGQS